MDQIFKALKGLLVGALVLGFVIYWINWVLPQASLWIVANAFLGISSLALANAIVLVPFISIIIGLAIVWKRSAEK